MSKLERKFFCDPTLDVAKRLLGKYLVRQIKDKKIVGKIVETEAYIGPDDRAAHSYGGKITARSKIEYWEGGYIYIYLVYGMYWQLNITTAKEGKPECVLIRALEPKEGIEEMMKARRTKEIKNLTNGPGKLCQALKLDKSFYGEDVCKSKRIWIEDRGELIQKSNIVSAKRIGIDYAKEWADKLWRFYLKDSLFVSKK